MHLPAVTSSARMFDGSEFYLDLEDSKDAYRLLKIDESSFQHSCFDGAELAVLHGL